LFFSHVFSSAGADFFRQGRGCNALGVFSGQFYMRDGQSQAGKGALRQRFFSAFLLLLFPALHFNVRL
jgi:hypothetical protein